MNIHWFKNPDNIVYAKEEDFVSNFAKETGIANLAEQVSQFRKEPTAEGLILKGVRRTSLKLFVPDLMFDEHLEMGENVWVYLGQNYPCYVLYRPWEVGEDDNGIRETN